MPSSSSARRRATIAVTCMAVLMLMLDISVINTALSDIAAGLNTDLHGLQWVVDAYTLLLAATVLSAGALADRLGRRRMFLAGLVLFTVSSASCATAPTIDLLVASRIVQGLGAALLFTSSLCLLVDVSPTPAERGAALAVFGASIGGAFAVGPFVGGGLTELLGWRAIFWVNVPVGALAFAGTLRWVRESRDEHARRVDWPGQIALIAGMFLLTFALLHGNDDGWLSSATLLELGGSVVLLAIFAIVQERSDHPMLPLRLFAERRFAGAQIAALSISGSFFALFLYITLYLQGVLGLSPIQTGLVYLPATVLMFVLSGATAPLSAKIAPAKLACLGLALVAAGMSTLLLTATGSSWTITLPGMLLAWGGTGIFNPAASALALDALPAHQSGLASGAMDLFRQTGIAVGIAGLGAFVPAGASLGGDPAAYVTGFHHAVLAASVLAAIGVIATLVLLVAPQRVAGLAPSPSASAGRP